MTDKNPNTEANSRTIPDGWVVTTLGEVVLIKSEKLKISNINLNNYISTENLLPDRLGVQISTSLPNVPSVNAFKKDDTLFSNIRTYFKKVWYARFDGGCSNDVLVFTPRYERRLNKKFLYYLISSDYFINFTVISAKGTKMPRGDKEAIKSFTFNLPPHLEQQAIASVLSAFDDKIELLRDQNKTLEELGQTIFNEWFGKYSVEGEDSKPSQNNIDNKISVGADSISARETIPIESKRAEIDSAPTINQNNINVNIPTKNNLPEGWRVGKLSEIAEFLNGIALQKFPAKNDDDFLPVIKIRELKAGITAQTDKASKNIDSKYIVDDGDVLFSWSGSLEIVIWKYGKGALNQHLFKVSSLKYPKWFYYFWTLYHLPEFREIASNKATTMGHIQRHHLDEARVIIPDVNIMQNFDNKMSPILEKTMLINQEIQSLTRTRDELLPKLMSGDIRVNNVS